MDLVGSFLQLTMNKRTLVQDSSRSIQGVFYELNEAGIKDPCFVNEQISPGKLGSSLSSLLFVVVKRYHD